MERVSRRFWLLLPALTLYSADITLTLVGQPSEYWAGDYSGVVEYNPIVYLLLAYHPTAFAGAALVWGAAVGTFVLVARRPLAWWAGAVLALGSAVGGSSWLARQGTVDWALAVAYLVAASWLTGVCWRRVGTGPSDAAEPPGVECGRARYDSFGSFVRFQQREHHRMPM